jgi:hypothetical protein
VCVITYLRKPKFQARNGSFYQKSCRTGRPAFYLHLKDFSKSNIASNRLQMPFPAIFAIFLKNFTHTRTRALENSAFP